MYIQKINAMYLLCSFCISKYLVLLRWDTGKVRGRFSGLCTFNNVVADEITSRYFQKCNYDRNMHVHNKCIVPNHSFNCN